MRITAALTIVLLSTGTLLADNYKQITTLRDRAKAAIADGSVVAERDIAPMVNMLRKSHDDDDQRHLIDAIIDLGRADGTSPAAVKRYVIDNMTPILIDIASNTKNSTFLRGDAIHGMRDMGASREALQTVATMALADKDDYVKSRGEIIENYIRSMPAGSTMKSIKAVDPAKEREALAFLKDRDIGASTEQLGISSHESKADEVRALIAAGVDPNADDGNDTPPLVAAVDACSSDGESDAIVETVDALVKGGADVKHRDENKNTVMINAAQYCGAKVIDRLVAAGAEVNVVNGSGITPLQLALLTSHYDAAEALVAHGAKLTKDQAAVINNSVSDPRAKAIAKKATGVADAPAKKKK